MPDGRVLVEAVFVLVLMLMVVGFFIGTSLTQLHHLSGEPLPFFLELFSTILLLFILMYPFYDGYKTYQKIPEYRKLSISWDKWDEKIRAARLAGESKVVVKGYDAPGDLPELQSESYGLG